MGVRDLSEEMKAGLDELLGGRDGVAQTGGLIKM
jgi:hypothetical protein